MKTKRILWVEDDEDLLQAGVPMLEREGWEVNTADSAEGGKASAQAARPDLIIMDVILPGEHGYSALEDMKNAPQLADVPAIVFSNLTERWADTTATREHALLSEATEFVDKSGGPKALVNAVRRHL